MLHHRQQPELWGCLYHALYALTGDESVLAHVRDISNARFYCRLHDMGLMVVALHRGPPAEPEFWETLDPSGVHALLLTLPAERMDGVGHAVALKLRPGREAQVSNSRDASCQQFSWAEFLRSPYARPLGIEVIAPAQVDAYPFEDAERTLGRALSRDRPDPHPDLAL